MDKVLLAMGIGFALWCVGDAIVRIIRAGKGTGNNSKVNSRLEDVESDLADIEQELEDARNRIQVLEKIVTDDRQDLKRQIDGL